MRAPPRFTAALFSLVVAGCGGGGSDAGPSFQCSTVPACYTEAVTALRACVTTPALTLMRVAPMSGTINGLTCTATGVTVAFSTFSSSPTGTVPLPSTVTISSGGAFCGELKSGTGTRTDHNGATMTYALSTIRVGTSGEVAVETYEDGSIGVNCTPPSSQGEVIAPAGALDSCPGAVVAHKVVRNDMITHMGVDLVDASGGSVALFACD
jgi:hypothetical protein